MPVKGEDIDGYGQAIAGYVKIDRRRYWLLLVPPEMPEPVADVQCPRWFRPASAGYAACSCPIRAIVNDDHLHSSRSYAARFRRSRAGSA
jgi:hypothetical protein